MKFPYMKQMGFPEGNYRVGPFARLNIADNVPTERASELYGEYKDKYGMAQNPLLYHYARLVELMYSVERAIELLEDDAITGTNIKTGFNEPLMTIDEAKKSDKKMRGVGVIEAPRGPYSMTTKQMVQG